jgi:polysaccharide pyruvyl transferase WcaK-like protein
MNTLDTLETALALRKPTAMFGLGLSGEHSEEGLAHARQILPCVDLIAVRERGTGPQLLHILGVSEGRIAVTGDDAIEAAFRLRPGARGQSLGVNLRVQRTSGVDPSCIATLRPVIHGFAKRHGARLQPLPGANDRGIHDCETIRSLIDGYEKECDGGEALDEPRKVILAVGRCRAVFTGAYHIAVFALSQGIPTVCVAHSDYFTDKMLCLAAMFGAGSHFVSLRHADAAQHIEDALGEAWNAPESTRRSLIAAASRQIEAGYAAYRRLLTVCAPALQPEADVLAAS